MGEKEVKELICQFEDYIGSLHHRLDTMEILIKSRTKSIKVGHWTEESKLSHSQNSLVLYVVKLHIILNQHGLRDSSNIVHINFVLFAVHKCLDKRIYLSYNGRSK